MQPSTLYTLQREEKRLKKVVLLRVGRTWIAFDSLKSNVYIVVSLCALRDWGSPGSFVALLLRRFGA